MPQPKKYSTNAQRQAAYRARTQEAQREQLRAKGLPPLPALPAVPGMRRWRAALNQVDALLTMITQQMTDYSDQRSDDWHESERSDGFNERLEAAEQLKQQSDDCQQVWA